MEPARRGKARAAHSFRVDFSGSRNLFFSKFPAGTTEVGGLFYLHLPRGGGFPVSGPMETPLGFLSLARLSGSKRKNPGKTRDAYVTLYQRWVCVCVYMWKSLSFQVGGGVMGGLRLSASVPRFRKSGRKSYKSETLQSFLFVCVYVKDGFLKKVSFVYNNNFILIQIFI